MATHARRACASGSASSSTSSVDPLPSSNALSATERSAICLLPQGEYDPWEYNANVLEAAAGDGGSIKWGELSNAPYLRKGPGKLVRWCTLAGASTGRLESCHLVPAEHGETIIKGLVEGNAVPAGMRHEAPANRFPLRHEFHRALDHGALHLLPTVDDVLARLAGEVMYYEQRKAADPAKLHQLVKLDPRLRARSHNTPSQPFLLARTANDLTENASSNNLALLPPIEILCSLNLLIAGMNGRLAQSEPVPLAVVEESETLALFAHLLYRIWHLREGDESHMDSIVRNVQHLVSALLPDHPLAPYLLHPTDHSIDTLPLLPQPNNTLRSSSHLTDPAQRLAPVGVAAETQSVSSDELLSEQDPALGLIVGTDVERAGRVRRQHRNWQGR
ncbi:hypothetical protein NBRC10512_001313 [Rhodotorula toruloides]|uniref:RHTO0S16e01596g1_1 n=2 Tax=Rhodotorula toruloides TaxID=5286 RepID=A0A061BDV2_RHOTO|nr:uncharacterized protein RHTO_02224 [Rhodotorula toruloides NP11]EMS21028.1 hypothetical protein RHTO_02224 [Rhodotorula toruloides NP11]CDR48116.1 RHTO0S16e01596g1_1 [Rhodotorula toruloides]